MFPDVGDTCPMLATPPPPKLSLSVDDVKRWAAERADAQRIADDRTKKLEAAQMLFGDLAVEGIIREAEAATRISDPKTSMTVIILELLKSKKVGVTVGELLDEIRSLPSGEKIKKNPNNVYNSVAILVGRDEVIRHGKLLYTVETFGRVSSGTWADPRFATKGDPNPVREAVLAVLKAEGRGMGPYGIIEKLLQDPEMARRNAENPKYFHSLLSKMFQAGDLKRYRRLYVLPEWETPAETSIFDEVHDEKD